VAGRSSRSETTISVRPVTRVVCFITIHFIYLFIYFDVAERASGKYILFMDDDDIAKPHQLETYARVALATNAELLTTGHDLFPGTNTVKRRKPNVFF